ncbi:MAG: tetratricopeptide repeat protein [Bacteroidetes bacterium]|nr:tetratricopeptide repeat protein [Bacteroidota bacterium]
MLVVLSYNCHTEKINSENISEKYASLDSTVGYVGMQTCKECHSSIYETFIQTGMGKSFDVASQTKSAAKFGNHQLVYDKNLDFYYQPFWDRDSLRIMEFRMEGMDTVYKRIETVSYIVGSGHHTNSHIMNTEGYLNQMPMTFYTQKGQWDLPPGFENGGNSRFSRLIGLECMSCHNSYPKFTKGWEKKYEFVDNGIGCERCHGPGESHVKDKKMGKAVDVVTGIDYSIVNPAKLPISLQMDVCQRCHIQGNAVLNDGKSFLDFKPGMKLSDIMNVFMPVYKGREQEHIMASHVERLKLSKCFSVSIARSEQQATKTLTPYKNALTCITCHDPHVSVKQTGPEKFNAACKSCHSSEKDGLCSEKPEVLNLTNNNCISCHMPSSGATDIPHVSVHDHYIRIPVKEESISQLREFIGINCINNTSPTSISKGKAFIAYFEKFNFGKEVLDSAKKYFPDNTVSDIKKNFIYLVHIAFLEDNFNQVIKYVRTYENPMLLLNHASIDNSHAWTSYRIGDSFFQTGDLAQAMLYYKNAYELAPLHPDFANKYATSLAQNKRISEGKSLLEKTVLEYPKYPAAISNLGYLILLQDGDTSKAMQFYNRALELDPDYDQAILNKAGLYMYTGKKEKAKTLLIKYLERRPGHPKVTELLNKIESI